MTSLGRDQEAAAPGCPARPDPGGLARARLVPYLWETNEAAYDPARRYANFVVADGPSALPGMKLSAELTFGRPAQIYQAGGYTIMVWNKNLLAELDGPGLT